MLSKQKGKSITIWSDGIISIEFFLLTAIEIYFGFWAGMRCFGYFGGFPAGKNIFLGVVFIILGHTNLIVLYFTPFRALYWITLSDEGVVAWTLFHQKKARPYSAYPYIHAAYYSFFGVKRRFFIMSDRQISTEDRNRANLLGGTMEVLKIRYSERNYQRMMKMLPRRQKSQLKIAHDTILAINRGTVL